MRDITLTGTIKDLINVDDTYILTVESFRLSGISDILSVYVTKEQYNEMHVNAHIKVNGVLFKNNDNITCIQANELTELASSMPHDSNTVCLTGTVGKYPNFRITKNNKYVLDLFIRTDIDNDDDVVEYIPCALFDDCAVTAWKIIIGTPIKIYGHLQSRKFFQSKTCEYKTTTEVAVYRYGLDFLENKTELKDGTD